ncbi:MAG TPA: hypothetical protein VM841_00315 [Actinomycetota bacterium]|nr:hypothetical protein [Actinomycetota bacterium]
MTGIRRFAFATGLVAVWVTEPLDWSVIAPTREASLTPTTAHPPRTARDRLIARFVLRRR